MNDKFVPKLYQMLENTNLSSIISWSDHGDAVMIWSEENLGRVLPQYGFKTNNFSAIQRQLNFYGFRKIAQGKNPTVYKHDYFYRGSQMLHEIKKRTAVRSATKTVEPISSGRTTRSTTKSFSVPSPVTIVPSPSSVIDLSESVFSEVDISQEILEVLEPVAEESFEKKRLSDENRMLKEEMMRLRSQQEATQMMMREMMSQLQRNKEETDSLKHLVSSLIEEVQQKNPIRSCSDDIFSSEPVGEIQTSNVNTVEFQMNPNFEMLQQQWKLEDIQFDQLILN